MKLLDILVRDLGHWPYGVESMMQCNNTGRLYRCDVSCSNALLGGVRFEVADDANTSHMITRQQYDAALAEKVNGGWIEWGGGECPADPFDHVDVKFRDGDDDKNVEARHLRWNHKNWRADIIAYRLHVPEENAAPSVPEWNGEGLPPVGIKCEHCPGGTTQQEWEVVTVAGVHENTSAGFTDYWLVKENGSSYIVGNPYRFRPLRTEEDKRRDAAKAKIADLCRQSASNGHSADLIYAAIAAGEIDGIGLTE